MCCAILLLHCDIYQLFMVLALNSFFFVIPLVENHSISWVLIHVQCNILHKPQKWQISTLNTRGVCCKYFEKIDSVLQTWWTSQISAHLALHRWPWPVFPSPGPRDGCEHRGYWRPPLGHVKEVNQNYNWHWRHTLLKSGRNFKNTIFNLVLLIGIFRLSYDNAPRRMPSNLTDCCV